MTQRNRSVVENAWRAFASHDADRISAVFTDDAEWLAPPGNATAVALEGPSHMIGKKAVVHFLAEGFPCFFARDVTVTFPGLYADGDRVIVEETMTATLANGNHYVNDYCFVFELRITLAAEPCGPALDDELHLLVRSDNRTTRLALALAPGAPNSVSPAPVAPDSNDASAYRIACVTTLLGEFLRINNTDAVTFEVTFGTHDIDLNVADPDAAFRAGWAGDEHWLIGEEDDDETDDVLWELDSDSLKAALTESELNLVAVARSRTLVWEFDSTAPEIPSDELVSWLARDLLETIVTEITEITEITEASGIAPVLAYAMNFPLESVLYGEGDSCLLLVGAHRTALIHISG
ncbi:nuclear transport factor 2 family protein [Streptomyces sirii]|uniref:nuclear transport factor 2 family protein n=1 Tax=Streptomyces sirii TaxID=3127701 RepID=UPI003D36F988